VTVLYSIEGNHRSGVVLAMLHRICGRPIYTYRFNDQEGSWAVFWL